MGNRNYAVAEKPEPPTGGCRRQAGDTSTGVKSAEAELQVQRERERMLEQQLSEQRQLRGRQERRLAEETEKLRLQKQEQKRQQELQRQQEALREIIERKQEMLENQRKQLLQRQELQRQRGDDNVKQAKLNKGKDTAKHKAQCKHQNDCQQKNNHPNRHEVNNPSGQNLHAQNMREQQHVVHRAPVHSQHRGDESSHGQLRGPPEQQAPHRAQSHGDNCHSTSTNNRVLAPVEHIMSLELNGYYPAEIKIKTKGNTIYVEGKQVCGCADSCVIREFERVHTLPSSVDTESITATLNQRGQLEIEGQTYPYSIEAKDTNIQVQGLGIPERRQRSFECLHKKPTMKIQTIDQSTGRPYSPERLKYNTPVYSNNDDGNDDDVTVEVEE